MENINIPYSTITDWAHARRMFFERKAKDESLTIEQLLALRQTAAVPIYAGMGNLTSIIIR